MNCSRPIFQPSDSININCSTNSRDNYALLPYRVAPMAPSGPIDWGVKKVTSLLDLIAESCRRSYDPLTCIQGTPGFWIDLAQKFRQAGLGSLVDTGTDSTNNCFWTPGATYTIPPIDPNSLKNFDMSTYPWGRFFDLTYYFRSAPSNVRPAPSPQENWGVYQIYEYPNETCSGSHFSDCMFVAMSMSMAADLGTDCTTYASMSNCPWTRSPNTLSFKIHSRVTDNLTESDAKNLAKKNSKGCEYNVYEAVYTEVCGGDPVCNCKFVVLSGDVSKSCKTIGEEDVGEEATVPTDCFGAQKVKYVKKAGPYATQALAEVEREKLERACESSSLGLWYVYQRFHYPGDCTEGEEEDPCDFIATQEVLVTETCLVDDEMLPNGSHTWYEWVPNAIFDTQEEAEEYAAELRENCLPEVSYYVYRLIEDCTADPAADTECNYQVIDSEELEELLEECLVESGYDIDDFCCALTDIRYINQTEYPFSTYEDAAAYAETLRGECAPEYYIYKTVQHSDETCDPEDEEDHCNYVVSLDPNLDGACVDDPDFGYSTYTYTGEVYDDEATAMVRATELKAECLGGSSSSGAYPDKCVQVYVVEEYELVPGTVYDAGCGCNMDCALALLSSARTITVSVSTDNTESAHYIDPVTGNPTCTYDEDMMDYVIRKVHSGPYNNPKAADLAAYNRAVEIAECHNGSCNKDVILKLSYAYYVGVIKHFLDVAYCPDVTPFSCLGTVYALGYDFNDPYEGSGHIVSGAGLTIIDCDSSPQECVADPENPPAGDQIVYNCGCYYMSLYDAQTAAIAFRNAICPS